MPYLDKLFELSAYGKSQHTPGLAHGIISSFLNEDARLQVAIDQAYHLHHQLRETEEAVLRLPEEEQVTHLQSGFVNFYNPMTVNPYVALAANGPWMVTTYGAVLYDTGGYGMLGFGHAPEAITAALRPSQVMANIMTANFAQKYFIEALRREIGHTRQGGCPFSRFLSMNSGSEAVTVALRISDLFAKKAIAERKKKSACFLSIAGSFHGRTERPAQASGSTLEKYKQYLWSFSQQENLVCVPSNDREALENAFHHAEAGGVHFESMLFEPVMGEGSPGEALTPAYYELARHLTAKHGSLLIADSIQAGLRAHGVLSIVDYPGFTELAAPDMETYSKALNAGQFPLSVLAMSETVAEAYVEGLYGNTMTANPRGLEIGAAVLAQVTSGLRSNIRSMGDYAVKCFEALAEEYPHVVEHVQGTGLLFSVALRPEKARVVGANGVERFMRRHGVGVIHGGKNALRFTPVFDLNQKEVDLLVTGVRGALEAMEKGESFT
jgi:acetylornithine/succinyldiaminopimelate/putrescine aminotransferase